MTYIGLQKGIVSLLAACGLGGAGYGTHKYIKYSQIHTNSVATRLHNATSTITVLGFTAVPESNAYTTDANTSETEVRIQVESLPSVPSNTAFRKQGFGGPLSRSSIIVGIASLFLPAVNNVGALGWTVCGLALLVMLYMVFHSENVRYLSNWPIPQHATQIATQTQTNEKDLQIASLRSDLKAAQSMIVAIHQVADPDSISPEAQVLDLVRNLRKSRKLSDKQYIDTVSRDEKNIVGEKANLEQVGNRIRMLEESNFSLKGDLKRSEDEIARLIEQIEIDKADYKRKKEHYKAIAHYVVNANDATRITEQATENSLQKRLREIMADHNEKLSTSQQDNESLRKKLAIAGKHQEGMSQKLAKYDQETIQQNIAIEAEVKRLRENENAQLLRTQKLEDASAERERKLRDQLEKAENDRMTEVNWFETKIGPLKEKMKILEDKKTKALGDLQKYAQDFERNLNKATQEKDTAIATVKTENKALKSSILIWRQKEDAWTNANTEFQGRIQKLETELISKLKEKERQVQSEKKKYDDLRAFVKSKVKKPSQDRITKEHTTKDLANENTEIKKQPPASVINSHSAQPQKENADDEDRQPQNMEVPGSGEPVQQRDFIAASSGQESVLNEIQNTNDEKEQLQPRIILEPSADNTLQEKSLSPVCAPDSPTKVLSLLVAELTTPQRQDVAVAATSPSLLQEQPTMLEAREEKPRGGEAGSSFSTAQIPAVNSANSTQDPPSFTMLTTNIPGLHSTASKADSAQSLLAPGSSAFTQPPPILLDFHPVTFTASVPAVPQTPIPTDQVPHDTAYQFNSTPLAQPKYFATLSQGRRSTEAEIGARRRLQPRRQNQTINKLRQTTPRSQSMSSTLQFDPQALITAMAQPPAAPTQPDAPELYDKANALAKIFTTQAGSLARGQLLNASSPRLSIFEGKTFDLNVPLPSAQNGGILRADSTSAQSTVIDGKNNTEDEVEW